MFQRQTLKSEQELQNGTADLSRCNVRSLADATEDYEMNDKVPKEIRKGENI